MWFPCKELLTRPRRLGHDDRASAWAYATHLSPNCLRQPYDRTFTKHRGVYGGLGLLDQLDQLDPAQTFLCPASVADPAPWSYAATSCTRRQRMSQLSRQRTKIGTAHRFHRDHRHFHFQAGERGERGERGARKSLLETPRKDEGLEKGSEKG